MSQAYVGGVAAVVLAAILYAVGRRPSKPFLRNPDVSSVAALNRAQVELVQTAVSEPELEADQASLCDWQAPSNPGDVLALQKRLRSAMDGSPDERLEAVRIAGLWQQRALLPLLRRGLRDSDSRVVEAAAAALDGRRGAPVPQVAKAGRPPRNVARLA